MSTKGRNNMGNSSDSDDQTTEAECGLSSAEESDASSDTDSTTAIVVQVAAPSQETSELPSSQWKKVSPAPIEHLLCHGTTLEGCPGCAAKARGRKRMKGAYDAADPKNDHTVTMDQVTVEDLSGTRGIGGFTYAIMF